MTLLPGCPGLEERFRYYVVNDLHLSGLGDFLLEIVRHREVGLLAQIQSFIYDSDLFPRSVVIVDSKQGVNSWLEKFLQIVSLKPEGTGILKWRWDPSMF